MFVIIYYKPGLFNAHTMILIGHIFMNVNELCLNQGNRASPKIIHILNNWQKTRPGKSSHCIGSSKQHHYFPRFPRPVELFIREYDY